MGVESVGGVDGDGDSGEKSAGSLRVITIFDCAFSPMIKDYSGE